MFASNRAYAAGNHNWLVVTANFVAVGRFNFLFIGTEVPAGIGPTEFVVERGRTDRTFEHDIERRRNSFRLAVLLLPGLLEAGDFQIGYRETTQSCLGFGADAGCALVPDFAPRTGRRTRKRRDRGRMIVRFDLHQNIELRIFVAIAGIFGGRVETARGKPFDNGRVIVIGGQDSVVMHHVRVLDHLE